MTWRYARFIFSESLRRANKISGRNLDGALVGVNPL